MVPDYYQILGVDPDCDPKALQEAWRRLAKENHPDIVSKLSPEEQAARGETMRDANIAYGVLKNPAERVKYDALRQSGQAPEGWTRRPVPAQDPNKPFDYRTFFDNIFAGLQREGGLLDVEWRRFFERPQAVAQKDVWLPENDWGLLSALKAAYEAKNDGVWQVSKAASDTREWLPETVYSVKKEGDQVSVSRVIKDWRGSHIRNSEIGILREKGKFADYEVKLSPDSLFDERYLAGKDKWRLDDKHNFPSSLNEYLAAMKAFARKLAAGAPEGQKYYDIDSELKVINNYARFGSAKTRIEGAVPWSDAADREVVSQTSFREFWYRLAEGETRVSSVEGVGKTPEKQNPAATAPTAEIKG